MFGRSPLAFPAFPLERAGTTGTATFTATHGAIGSTGFILRIGLESPFWERIGEMQSWRGWNGGGNVRNGFGMVLVAGVLLVWLVGLSAMVGR